MSSSKKSGTGQNEDAMMDWKYEDRGGRRGVRGRHAQQVHEGTTAMGNPDDNVNDYDKYKGEKIGGGVQLNEVVIAPGSSSGPETGIELRPGAVAVAGIGGGVVDGNAQAQTANDDPAPLLSATLVEEQGEPREQPNPDRDAAEKPPIVAATRVGRNYPLIGLVIVIVVAVAVVAVVLTTRNNNNGNNNQENSNNNNAPTTSTLSPTVPPSKATMAPTLSTVPTMAPSASPAPSALLDHQNVNWQQIGQDLYGSDTENYTSIRWKLDISADGNTIAVGGQIENSTHTNMGEVTVYEYNDQDDQWVQLGQTLQRLTAKTAFSSRVALSDNGRTLAVGERYNQDTYSKGGKVFVYSYNDVTKKWEQLASSYADLEAGADGDDFGVTVALSGDGLYLGVGASQFKYGTGYVNVYDYRSDLDYWSSHGDTIFGDDMNDAFGLIISMSQDGQTLAIAAPFADSDLGDDSGLVRVFSYTGNGNQWIKIGQDIIGDGPLDDMGALSISSDGGCIAVGARQEFAPLSPPGYARVFCLQGNEWVQDGPTLLGDKNGDGYGGVIISGDAQTLLVAATAAQDGLGVVTIYRRVVNEMEVGWEPIGDPVTGDEIGDNYGKGKTISKDGNTFIAGAAIKDGSKLSYVRVYRAVVDNN